MDDAPAPKADNCVRIVIWNCRSGFDGPKFDRLVALEPDVAVVPESCTPERLARKRSGWTSAQWLGHASRPTKGLSVLSFGDWTLTPLPAEPQLERFLPVRVRGSVTFDLIGTWCRSKHPGLDAERKRPRSQLEQLPEAFADLWQGDVVIAGDFNHSASFGVPEHRSWGRIAAALDGVGLASAYHEHRGEPFGAESYPTHWHGSGRPRHIDYCFFPNRWTVRQVWVGGQDAWNVPRRGSDHAPLVVDLEPPHALR